LSEKNLENVEMSRNLTAATEMSGTMMGKLHLSSNTTQLQYYSITVFCGRPCDMELVIRQSERSGHQQTHSSVYWRRLYFQLTCVHNAL